MSFNSPLENNAGSSLKAHLGTFFLGHTFQEMPPTSEKLQAILPAFRVLIIAPGSKLNLWCYVSSGMAALPDRSQQRMELLLFAPTEHPRHTAILTLLAYYHTLPRGQLALGDTVPIGEPWLEHSRCDHFLLSPLYPLPRTFAGYQAGGQHIHLVWALPITQAERNFKATYGREALEQRFEHVGLRYWDPNRRSVIDAE